MEHKRVHTNEVYLGNCLEVMKSVEDHTVDMVLCDLPYGITGCKWDTPIDLELLWAQYKRVIKPGGAVVLTATMPFGAKLIMSNPKWFRHELIWVKDNISNPFHANVMPLRIHENILVFCSKGTIYNPQKVEAKPYTSLRVNRLDTPFCAMRGEKRKNRDVFTNQKEYPRVDSINTGYRFPQTVIKFKKDHKPIHSTQKPVALFEWLIRTYSNEGDTILDNCSGSGTTAIAAINTGRNYILIEKEEKYYELSKSRIKGECNGT